MVETYLLFSLEYEMSHIQGKKGLLGKREDNTND
ncbi:hypothetical protein ACVWXX_005370 [Bacillus toyonensis]|nr:hypothetical protein IEA_00357 [Bacillus toyonensis]EJV96709.1 hypothetical protein IGI_00285 [Bacillus toyonensis]EOP36432.1 hypothetical protein IKI_04529 [Bacillus toyonensis]